MAVVFESLIKVGEDGMWFIELKDTLGDRVVLCHDLEEYFAKIEDFGADYGGTIDEVKWTKDESVPPHVMDELRLEMSKHQADIEKNKAEKQK
jgi:hypothetical protein